MNFDTKEWAEVVEQIDAAIEAAKEALCRTMPESQTAFVRGGIAYLHQLRRWPEIEKEEKKALENPESPLEFGV